MADYLLELRKSIDDQKKRTAILKPSAKAALEKQYGMTDGGGQMRTAANAAVKPTTARTGQQSSGLLKPSAQAAREKQYGMTDSGGGIAGAAVKQAAARTGQTTVIKPSAKAVQEQQYGIVDWKNTKPQTAVKPEAAALVSARPEEKPEKQKWAKTVLDVADRGAGYGVQGISTAIDVAVNALPIVEGWVFGTDKDATFTGQVLRPITYLTGKFDDWIRATNANTQARIENDTRDSKVAQVAADIGSGVVGALPSTVMAILSGGSSAAAQLGTQATGISGTVVNAANTMLHNPVVQYNFAASLGNEFNAAKASGASDMDAMTAATVSGLFNAIVESGGVEALPKQLQGADLSTGQKALKWMFSTFSEGSEEPVQGLISEMTAKAAYDYDKPYFSTTDENAVVNPGRMVREFGYGTAIGGITGAVPMASRKAVELWGRSVNADNAVETNYADWPLGELDELAPAENNELLSNDEIAFQPSTEIRKSAMGLENTAKPIDADEKILSEYIRQLRQAQMENQIEELRQAYLLDAEMLDRQENIDTVTSVQLQSKHTPGNENETENATDTNNTPYFHTKMAENTAKEQYGIRTLNDYIGVQKSVVNTLEQNGYFEKPAIVNDQSGMVIEITKDGIRETLGPGKRFEKLPKLVKLLKINSIEGLPELIRTATLVSDNVPNQHNPKSKLKYAYFLNTLESDIDGSTKQYEIVIDIRKSNQKNKFWSFEIRPIEKEQGLSLSGDKNLQQRYTKTPVLIKSISDSSEKSNTGARKNTDKAEYDPIAMSAARDEKTDGAVEEEYLAFIRRLEEAQVMLEAEELRQAYLRNMARLEEEKREAEMDAAFWKYWD